MEQYAEFVANHWILVSFLVLLVGLLIASFFHGQAQGASALGPLAVTQLINHEDALVLDLRDPGTFVKGHILGALNVPLSSLTQRLDELEKHQEKPIVICCQEGLTSKKAVPLLAKAGFEKLYLLQGGISEWRNTNLPLSKGRRK